MPSLLPSIVDGLRRAALVAVAGTAVGMVLYLLDGGTLSPPFGLDAMYSLVAGILYVAVLDATLQLGQSLMALFVPLRSVRAAALHAVVPAAGGIVVFAGLSVAFKVWMGAGVVPGWPMLLGLGGVAFLGAVGGLGVETAQRYHEQAQADQAEAWEAALRRMRARTCPPIVLDILSSLAAQDASDDETRNLLGRTAHLLQYRQQAQNEDQVPLADEVEALLSYVDLVKARHGDIVEVGFDIPDPLLQRRVPRLSVLPLLENAVQHGARAADAPCTITVMARHTPDRLTLAVLDTGPGFDTTDPETVLRRGSGLADLFARLRTHHGAAADLSLLPQGVLWGIPLPPAADSESPPQDGP